MTYGILPWGILVVVTAVVVVLYLHFIRNNRIPNYHMSVTGEVHSIPRLCHQTWRSHVLPPRIEELRATNKRRNPDVEFLLYDDSDVATFLTTHFPPDVTRAYSRIDSRLGAARADFFRYCVLFVRGGMYLDVKSELKCDIFKRLIQPSDECVLDFGRYDFESYRRELGFHTHEQWFMISKPGHEYFRQAIQMLVHNILYESPSVEMKVFKGSSATDSKQKVLRVTGPDFFSIAIHKSIIQVGVLHREADIWKYAKLNGVPSRDLYDDIPHYSRVDSDVLTRLG
jgi:hypothetical protein